MGKLNELTGLEAAAKIAKREISSVELVQDCLDRISSREDDVGAWQYLDPEYAISEARRSDELDPIGPFHGVPFGVKDVIDTGEMPTEYGSEIFAGNQPYADAACVSMMRESGAVLLGKTVTTEFAVYQWRKTRNPHDIRHTPGGSSSGSAAAVGDNMVPLAFGNQTAGSLIRPASFCGVHAFKPTHGTANLRGIFEMVPRFDTLGYMARSIDDLAIFYAVVSKDKLIPRTVEELDRLPRIGICQTHYWDEAQPETVTAVESAASMLAKYGCDVGECKLPDSFRNLAKTHTTILNAGLARSMSSIRQKNENQISKQLLKILDQGLSTSAEELVEAFSHADKCMMEFPSITAEFDVLLTASAPGEAPEGWATGNPIFQIMWTLLQVPCLTLPWTTGPNGLPVGVQLIGRKGADNQLLRVAKWIEKLIG
jgi:Asp-tRNA(Asn)/Glu-tRNA(Gln) amidotransferase A subunit family amidase